MRSMKFAGVSFLFVGVVAACASTNDDGITGSKGAVQVFVEPEDTIPNGLEPGTEEENIKDGWKVTYDKFVVTVGNFRATRSDAPGDRLSDPTVYVLDLKNAPAGGYVIKTFDGVAAVHWDKVGYDLPNAKAGVRSLPPTAQADVDFMVQKGYSVYVEGSIEKPDGQSCTPGSNPAQCVPATKVTFKWGLAAGASYDDCAGTDEVPGFAVPTGGSVGVKPTIHGDHWFFTNTVQSHLTERFAQWIADSDLDHDGETTLEELENVKAADVFPSPTYNLAGGLGGPIRTAYDYLLEESRTLGDYQGEGECPTRSILP